MINLFGLNLYNNPFDDFLLDVLKLVHNKKTSNYICVTGVHGIVESIRNNRVMAAHKKAKYIAPDGMPLVWLGRLLGSKKMERIYGPDIFNNLNRICEEKGYKVFLYGSAEKTLNLLRRKLKKAFPKLKITGFMPAPLFEITGPMDDKTAIKEINELQPDVVWVSLSTPKQELWMLNNQSRIISGLMIGVGAAFDFMAETKKQAPVWMRNAGLEWLFRLLSEPRRLGRRYLANNTLFIYYLVKFIFTNRKK